MLYNFFCKFYSPDSVKVSSAFGKSASPYMHKGVSLHTTTPQLVSFFFRQGFSFSFHNFIYCKITTVTVHTALRLLQSCHGFMLIPGHPPLPTAAAQLEVVAQGDRHPDIPMAHHTTSRGSWGRGDQSR